MRNRPCSCEGHTLDRMIQPTVMALLAEGPLHGYLLVERLASSPLLKGSKPNDTGVYRLLAVLQKQELVSSRLASSAQGPSKRVYRLTRCGKICLQKWLTTLDSYHQDLGGLLTILRDISARSVRR